MAAHKSVRDRLAASPAGSARDIVAQAYAEGALVEPSRDAIDALDCAIRLGDETAYHRALLAALTMSVESRDRASVVDDQAARDRAEMTRLQGEAEALRSEIAASLDGTYSVEGTMVFEHAPQAYEVAPYGWPTHAVLLTTSTVFTSQGRFALRVREVDEMPVKLRAAFGGFTQQWKVLEEVTDNADARRRLADLESGTALYRQRVEASGSARVPGQSIEQRASAWFAELRGRASSVDLPTAADVSAQRLDADAAALRPPPGLVESFLAQPLEDLASCCNEAPFSGTGGDYTPDWGTARADVRRLAAYAPSLIDAAITRDGNAGVAAALSVDPSLAERYGLALRAAQASNDTELKLQAARALALTGMADERTADALLDVIGLAATPDSEQALYPYYFAVAALEGLRAVKMPTPAQVARLRGFREFVSSNANIESVWTEVLDLWDLGVESGRTRSATP